MSNPRHSGAYTGKRDRLISRERILENDKASRYFDPEKCSVSRMIAAFPQPPTGTPKPAPKSRMSSPALIESSHPITTRFGTTSNLLKKDILARPCDDDQKKSLPSRDVCRNNNMSNSPDSAHAVCRGMLPQQLDDHEIRELSALKTVEVVDRHLTQRATVSADHCQADDQSLFDDDESDNESDNESFYADEVFPISDELFLDIPDTRDRTFSQSSSRTACSALRRDSSTSTLYTELTDDFKRVLSTSSLYECPALSEMPSPHARRSSSSTTTSLSFSSLSTPRFQPCSSLQRHTASDPRTPTWSSHNPYSEFSVNPYSEPAWLDDSISTWAEDTLAELNGAKRQDFGLLNKTPATIRRGGTKRALSFQGPVKTGLQRQDTVASILSRYAYKRGNAPAVPDLPFRMAVRKG